MLEVSLPVGRDINVDAAVAGALHDVVAERDLGCALGAYAACEAVGEVRVLDRDGGGDPIDDSHDVQCRDLRTTIF